MNAENNSSGATTATTSATATDKPKPVVEGDFLAEQARQAQAAMSQVIHEITEDLKNGIDVRHWTQQYPWISLGVAAVAGFAAAATVVPSKDETWKEKFESLKEALTPEPEVVGSNGKHAEEKVAAAAKPSMWSELLREAVKAARPIITSVVSGAVAAKASTGGGYAPGETPPSGTNS